MRVECESCRELVVASFAVDGETIRATCPACAHVTSARSTPAGTGSVTDALPAASATDACPKCGAALRDAATACGACGLAVARMAAYHDARDAAVPEPVRAAWGRAAAQWTDDARHDEVFQLAAAHNAYAWAAGRYRTRAKDPVAQRQLERLRRAAEATLLAGATVRPDASSKPYRATAGVLVMLVVIAGAGLLYAVIREHKPAAHTLAPPPGLVAPGQPGGPMPGGAPGTRAPDGSVRPLVPGHPVSSSTIK